jgi:hypothetical protein
VLVRAVDRAQPEPKTPSIAQQEFVQKEDHGMGAPRLEVETVGKGHDLVLLHSLLSDRSSYEPLAVRLADQRRLPLVRGGLMG